MSTTASVWTGFLLLLFASFYLGFGMSMAIFQFPGALERTKPDQFPQRFGGPVKMAVAFLTVWSTLMIIGGLLLTIAEWDEGGYRWGPLVYLIATVVATCITVFVIFPVNRVLNTPTDDAISFRATLARWIRLNLLRTVIWSIEWLAIALWLTALAIGGRA